MFKFNVVKCSKFITQKVDGKGYSYRKPNSNAVFLSSMVPFIKKWSNRGKNSYTRKCDIQYKKINNSLMNRFVCFPVVKDRMSRAHGLAGK